MISKEDELTCIVGSRNISFLEPVLQSYSMNIKPMPHQYKPEAVVMPTSTEQVVEIVKWANRTLTPVYLCTTGGTAQEAAVQRPGAIMIDFQEMTAIEVNEDVPYAVIEPGVTQGMLFEKVRPLGFTFAIPSAPHTTSVVTNHGPQVAIGTWPDKTGTNECLITGIEIVLPTGEVLRTGSGGAYDHGIWHYRMVMGGDITGMFLNSHGTFGAITKSAVRLFPHPEAFRTTFLHFDTIEECSEHMQHIARYELGDYISGQNWMLCAAGGGAKFPFDEYEGCVPEERKRELQDELGLANFEFHISQGGQPKVINARCEVLEDYCKKHNMDYEVSTHDGQLDPNVSTWMGMRELQGQGITTAFASKLTEFKEGFRTTVHNFIPIAYWPRIYQPLIDIANKNDLEVGCTFKPVGPFGYTSQVRHVHWWNDNVPGDRERAVKTCKESMDYSLSQGASVFRNIYHPEIPIKHFDPVYWDFLVKLKKWLDPNNIMQPGRLGLGGTEEVPWE